MQRSSVAITLSMWDKLVAPALLQQQADQASNSWTLQSNWTAPMSWNPPPQWTPPPDWHPPLDFTQVANTTHVRESMGSLERAIIDPDSRATSSVLLKGTLYQRMKTKIKTLVKRKGNVVDAKEKKPGVIKGFRKSGARSGRGSFQKHDLREMSRWRKQRESSIRCH